jgi:hypothetical protein
MHPPQAVGSRVGGPLHLGIQDEPSNVLVAQNNALNSYSTRQSPSNDSTTRSNCTKPGWGHRLASIAVTPELEVLPGQAVMYGKYLMAEMKVSSGSDDERRWLAFTDEALVMLEKLFAPVSLRSSPTTSATWSAMPWRRYTPRE